MRASWRLGSVALAVLLATWAGAAPAQDYPSRPIRLVVGFAPGGTTDYMARLLADRLRGPLGQSVFVENKTGANGSLGAEAVAKSEPDGYTLYFTTAGRFLIVVAFVMMGLGSLILKKIVSFRG